MSTQVVTIQQTIHGYRDGHRQLGSSVQLPPDAQRLMLILSDMSGPSTQSGFDSYLTGYPLSDTGYYAFARTWSAPEMDRPGCVWTHTLLIENADLARISDLGSLRCLFERPTGHPARSPWLAPLSWSRTEESGGALNSLSMTKATNVAVALYLQPDRPVFLCAPDAERCESMVLALWSQQWPRLRRAFRFCTGALSNRSSSEANFDLQIIPWGAEQVIRREVPAGVLLFSPSRDEFPSSPWVEAITEDLVIPDAHGLRGFLWRYGADSSAGRAAFRAHAECFVAFRQCVSGHLDIAGLVDVLASQFPEVTGGSRLKTDLLGDICRWSGTGSSDETFLRALTSTRLHAAFDPVALQLRGRVERLWREQPRTVPGLVADLLEADSNPFGELVVETATELLDPQGAVELEKRRPGILPLLIARNPTLAGSTAVWEAAPKDRREIFDTWVESEPRRVDLLPAVLSAVLSVGATEVAEDVFARLGDSAVAPLLDTVDQRFREGKGALHPTWRRVLGYRPKEVLAWLQHAHSPCSTSAALVASMLDPHTSFVHAAGTKVWIPFLPILLDGVARNERIHMLAFLLAMGFDNPDDGAPTLVAASFQEVYDTAAAGDLDFDAWRLLRGQVPSRSLWRKWDRCERLSHGLVDHFARLDWPTQAFLDAVRDGPTFHRVLNDGDDRPNGRAFLRRVARLVAAGTVRATSQQIDALRWYR